MRTNHDHQHAMRYLLWAFEFHRWRRMRLTFLLLATAFLVFVLPSMHVHAGDDERLTRIMLEDPELKVVPFEFRLPERLHDPWVKAINRPEPELQRLAADSITRAHQLKLRVWDDVVPRLTELLVADTTSASVRRACAQTLTTLESRPSAGVLWKAAQGTRHDIAQVVEPALASWDYKPARAAWLKRLDDPATTRLRLLLAIEALAVVQDTKASAKLLTRVQSPTELPTIRLAAARAAGQIEAAGNLSTAKQLTASQTLIDRLLAVQLLQTTSDNEPVAILKQLGRDKNVAVAGAALRRLLEIDPQHVYAIAETSTNSRDANIRKVAAAALAHQATPKATLLLTSMLGDHNPTLRRSVSKALTKLAATSDLTKIVVEESMKAVKGNDWRAIEQSAIILGSLDIEDAAPTFVELLNHRRIEVQKASAWALRKLEVKSTYPVLLSHVKEQYQLLASSKKANAGADFQVSQIMQLFGTIRYQKAEPFARRLVPKTPGMFQYMEMRQAAIWSLGYLHEGKAPADLAEELLGRLADTDSMSAENDELRAMCAITIGRMQHKSAVPKLRIYTNERGPAGLASRWAIEQLTGTKARRDKPIVGGRLDWFLVPIK